MYDGEELIDGVYEVTCGGCKRVAFSAQACPRCHEPAGLTRALASPKAYNMDATAAIALGNVAGEAQAPGCRQVSCRVRPGTLGTTEP